MSLNDDAPPSKSAGNLGVKSLETTGNTLRELSGLAESPEPCSAEDLTGSVFGRFRILSVLGRGGMGIVYLAEDAALAREVALKVLSLDVAEDPEHRQRLLREARASAALSHPNIAAIHEMGEVDGRLYIAMERIMGESLRQRIDKSPLSQDEAISIAKQILQGVAKAHEAGIVHRDIKPDNIMVNTEGVAKVLDFGIAKFVVGHRDTTGPNATTTEHGRLLGTPSYMSPEQANADAIDARSDVFSVGIVLYEMLTGKTPFRGRNFLDILAALARDDPQPISTINPDVEKSVELFVERCLRKDPAERYAHAGDALDALTHLQHELALPRETPKPSRRSIAHVPMAITVLLLGVLGVFWFSQRGSKQSTTTTATPNASVTPSASLPPGPIPTPITGHPPPQSENESAIAAYREGLQALRDGAYVVAHNAFLRTIELDPTIGAVYVRLVITSIWLAPSPEDVRRFYRKAISHRDKLAERDKLLLAALEPIVQHEPPDTEEAAKRLQEASERFPGDVELFAARSLTPFAPNMSPAAELDVSDHCLSLDPAYADCLQARASALFRLGRMEDAVAETNHCLEVSPAANDCLVDRMELHALFGRCEEMAEVARRMIANDTNDWPAHRSLATALLAQGRANTAVRAALERGSESAPAGPRERMQRFNDVHFALLEGRFDDAERAYLEWKPRDDKSPFENAHRALAENLIELYEVLGKPKDAAKVADEYLSTRDGWIKGFIRSMWDDPTIWFLKKKRDAGMISAATYEAERTKWMRLWESRLTPDMKPIAWMQAYVIPANTEEEAQEALNIRPELKALEYYRKQPTPLHNALGKVYLLAGRAGEAIPHLSAVARDCRLLYDPIANTLAHARLGKAQEIEGQHAEACNSYGVVLQRWGKSRPQISLVEDVRKHFHKLACKEQK